MLTTSDGFSSTDWWENLLYTPQKKKSNSGFAIQEQCFVLKGFDDFFSIINSGILYVSSCFWCLILRKNGGTNDEKQMSCQMFFSCPVNDEPIALKNQGTTNKKGDGTSWYQMFEGELS